MRIRTEYGLFECNYFCVDCGHIMEEWTAYLKHPIIDNRKGWKGKPSSCEHAGKHFTHPHITEEREVK